MCINMSWPRFIILAWIASIVTLSLLWWLSGRGIGSIGYSSEAENIDAYIMINRGAVSASYNSNSDSEISKGWEAQFTPWDRWSMENGTTLLAPTALQILAGEFNREWIYESVTDSPPCFNRNLTLPFWLLIAFTSAVSGIAIRVLRARRQPGITNAEQAASSDGEKPPN